MSDSTAAAAAEHDGAHGSHAGRPGSWVAVAIIFTGFVIGGVALCIGPSWTVFIVGAVVIFIGLIASGLVHLFSDVVVDAPRMIPEIVDYSLFGHSSDRRRGGKAEEPEEYSVRTDPHQFPHG